MRVSIKAINGVDDVNVSLKQGLATVTMKPGNAATLKQLHDAVAKNGFTMKQTQVTVAGQLVNDGGKLRLKVSGTSDQLEIIPDGKVDLTSFIGKTVEVAGTMPEGAKGQVPDKLQVKSIKEQK